MPAYHETISSAKVDNVTEPASLPVAQIDWDDYELVMHFAAVNSY